MCQAVVRLKGGGEGWSVLKENGEIVSDFREVKVSFLRRREREGDNLGRGKSNEVCI